jgi:hypothetical protein
MEAPAAWGFGFLYEDSPVVSLDPGLVEGRRDSSDRFIVNQSLVQQALVCDGTRVVTVRIVWHGLE